MDRIYEPVDVEGTEGQFYVDPQGYLIDEDGEFVRDDTGHIVNEHNEYHVDNSGNWILTGGEGVTLGPLGMQLATPVQSPPLVEPVTSEGFHANEGIFGGEFAKYAMIFILFSAAVHLVRNWYN